MVETVDANHPAYYAEVLKGTTRVANRSHEQSCPEQSIPNVGDSLTRRMRSLLDVVASISLRKRGDVSATIACLNQGDGGVDTQMYIATNENDDAVCCAQHLRRIFTMLNQVPYAPPADGSPKAIAAEFDNHVNEITLAIHDYSFEIFAYRVNKRKDKLPDVRRYIERGRTYFKDDHHTLMDFFDLVDAITETFTDADTKLSIRHMKALRNAYLHWTQHDLLPKDSLSDNQLTLLDKADEWLSKEHQIGFKLRRWAAKIMSFVVAVNRLFMLTRSRRLHNILKGKFSVEVLPSPATTPYHFDLSSFAKQAALDAALAVTTYHAANWADVRQSFINELRDEGKRDCEKPTIHAELAVIMAMNEGKIKNALPYIGVSKLSCIMCSHYIDAFNKVTNDRIAIRGTHGKAYTGWFWPELPAHDGELRPAFLKAVRRELVRDFERHAEKRGRLCSNSDSGVGSDFPEVEGETLEAKVVVSEFMAAKRMAAQ